MKAVYVEEAEKIVVKDIETPQIKADEVLINVHVAGICGSDLHTYKGLHPFRKPPVVIGHEVSGEVVKCGAEVRSLKIGDRVTVEPQVGTGESEGRMTGNVNYSDKRSAPGIGDWIGAMAEYFVAPVSSVIKLPDSVSHNRGVLVEPLAVGVHAVVKADVQPDDKVAILGAGPIGLLTLSAVRARGVEQTLITDVLDYSLEVAKEMGATETMNIKGDTDWIDKAKKMLGGSFDKVLITAGVPGIVNQSLLLLRKGGKTVTVAMFQEEQKIDIENLQQNEKEIIGCMTYNRADTEEALKIIEINEEPVEKVISHIISYKDAAEGFNIVNKKLDKSVKVLVEFD